MTALLAAFTVFLAGSIAGLVAVWCLLAIMPELVPQVPVDTSISLFLLLAVLLTLAGMLVMQSRSVALEGWMQVRGHFANSQHRNELDAWFSGLGPVVAFAAMVAPSLSAALLMVSPWMAIVFLGITYAAAHAATTAFRAFRVFEIAEKGDLPRFVFPRQFAGGFALALVAMVTGGGALHVAQANLDVIARKERQVLTATDSALSVTRDSGERLRLIHELRVQMHRNRLEDARRGQKQGVTSQAELLRVMVDLNRAEAELAGHETKFAADILRLEERMAQARRRLQSLQSAAPALK